MPSNNIKEQVLDARPDRLDLRDRIYQPRLKSLPPQYPETNDIEQLLQCYIDSGLILDQEKSGACTGFGLAAVINYLIWKDSVVYDAATQTYHCQENIKDARVSEGMLYHLARIYDEWEGEDYDGSSCRGVMKGWHRHGVCLKSLWQYKPNKRFVSPEPGWAENAVKQTLGAYYRIHKDSIVDMQSAIAEVGAVYCSAKVHAGWELKKTASLPVIEFTSQQPITGAHAFAIVGYTSQGFIAQNSWGEEWGYRGFAVISYSDWVVNGMDAWVTSRGVPIEIQSVPETFCRHSLNSVAADHTARSAKIRKALGYDYDNHKVLPWSEEEAYKHSLVIANNGSPKLTMVAAENAEASARVICYDNIKEWLSQDKRHRKIAIYAHGGLNSEDASISRIRVMAPYYKENGIYPLFVTWRTGIWETLQNLTAQRIDDLFSDTGYDATETKAEGFFDAIREPFDRAIEALARNINAKSIWAEMKDNARYASERAIPGYSQRGHAARPGGMVVLAEALQDLQQEFSDVEVHMIGHSAGSIILGYWLRELEKRQLSLASTTLYAPACTTSFANQYYKRAVEKEVISKESLYIHLMDDERELADHVGKIYGKSLLYLVSRALEDLHKMPLLGMEAAWKKEHAEKTDGKFHDSQLSEIRQWIGFIEGGNKPYIYRRSYGSVQTSVKGDTTDLSHGSFDNDINVVEKTLKKIKRNYKLPHRVENLTGF